MINDRLPSFYYTEEPFPDVDRLLTCRKESHRYTPKSIADSHRTPPTPDASVPFSPYLTSSSRPAEGGHIVLPKRGHWPLTAGEVTA